MVCRRKQNKETYIKKRRYVVLPSTMEFPKNLNFNISNNTD